MPMLCGGIGEAVAADAEIQQLCDTVRADAETKAGKTFDAFTAKSYAKQIVAGTNYFVKVHVGGDEHVHLRIYKTLPHAGEEVSLDSMQHNKTHADPIAYF
ncbi:cystatin-B-like [Acanthopagrus schlegelii]